MVRRSALLLDWVRALPPRQIGEYEIGEYERLCGESGATEKFYEFFHL